MVGASASPENMPCASVSPDVGLVPVFVQHESLDPMEVRPDVSLVPARLHICSGESCT